ncbi:ABC transporter, ATP-binding protein [Campylobacter pinnipediorum subsp. caledonicus]|uniref:ABC transporter, ATP-binding protein n=1 Tax=Campylobacter pinnipediorum subsp. caledonicus TaxID=1874362 RepID=A0A1S6U6F9_9BACT|nr:ABC-F family ATP-binding cassette domain-containing protein [Campylobacter pinnipediorum]AQW85430.1 ABC transporter, ATP-binding protein [Campylobacter pinnipediorum subsp. caledonicus]AQW87037.1 ABC transporter, ATP-binding protein [Campylobacter pinnipediorum subsp. caledonicus]
MALIDLIEVSKKFGANEILSEISLSINERERVAIIGKNGGGKSTLMKVICGVYDIDAGRVITQNNISVQMLQQAPKFDDSLNVKDAMNLELKEIFDARDEYSKTIALMEKDHDNPDLLAKSEELLKFIDSKDGWDIERKIEQVLEYFSLKEYEDRMINSLSGGEIRRVALGALILKKPDVLLLDEPTNHLDVYMVKFLEDMLKNSKQTIIFISHDRYFIDSIATRSIEIQDGKLSNFNGGYAYYLEKKQEILQSLAKSHETLLKQLKSEEEWLRRGVKARLKRNEGRKERVFAMREEAKKNPGIIKRVKLELERASKSFNQGGIDQNRKKMLFEIKNLGVKIDQKELFDGFNARVLQGERIAIVGKNGSGKSTLLKILLNQIDFNSGEIKRGDVKIGYFDQNRSELDDDKSLIEVFCPNGGDIVQVRGRNMHVYGYLKNFLFPKEFLDKPVGVLSGGEKNRVALALLFTKQYDVLVLDEPTNDLDIATINILEDYLQSFTGAIIFVSHDRYFVDKIANKLWVFKNKKIDVIHTEYSVYLELEDELNQIDDFSKELETEQNNTQKNKTKSVKLSYKQNKILNEYPALIDNLQSEINELNVALSDPAIYQELGINEIYKKLEQKKDELAALEDEYFEVLEILEEMTAD